MKNNNFGEIILGRRSVKVYDENVKISNEEILEIIDKAVTAPSSVNFQPWRFVVVNTAEGKEKLRPHVSFNSRQNDTSSAMIVVLADLKPQERAEEIYDEAVKMGYMPAEVKETILPNFKKMYDNMTPQQMRELVKIDSSLAAMQLMLVAREYGYDTNAIGGFNPAGVLDLLQLDPEKYTTVMLISIGKAAEEGRPSVRLKAKDITSFL